VGVDAGEARDQHGDEHQDDPGTLDKLRGNHDQSDNTSRDGPVALIKQTASWLRVRDRMLSMAIRIGPHFQDGTRFGRTTHHGPDGHRAV
jgi:hypothetical protein